jgi:Secretion system C-terminal sorting domain
MTFNLPSSFLLQVQLNALVIILVSFNLQGQWMPVGGGFSNSSASPAEVYDLQVFQGELYSVGKFEFAGGQPAGNIAKWNGTSWNSLPIFISGFPLKMEVFQNELIIIGYTGFFGSVIDNLLSKWDGTNWNSLDSNRFTTAFTPGTGPRDLDIFQGNLIVGGYYRLNDSGPSYTLLKWNGNIWDSFPINGQFMGTVEDLSHYEEKLTIAGNFDSVSGNHYDGYVFFDGANWFPPPPNYPFSNPESTYQFGNRLFIDGSWYLENNNYSVYKYASSPFKEPLVRESLMYSARGNKVVVIDSNLNQSILGDTILGSGRIWCASFYNDSLFIGGDFDLINGISNKGIAKYASQLPTGINNLDFINSSDLFCAIYPNPVNEILYVSQSISTETNFDIYIYSVIGELKFHKSHINKSLLTIDVKFLNPGVYIIKMIDGISFYKKQFIKK